MIPLIYLILPSLPLAILAHSLALLPPGYFNLEYLLIGVLAAFLPRSSVFALLFLESIADFLCAISITYMMPVKDLLGNLGSLSSLPPYRILEYSAAFVLVMLACAAVSFVRPRNEDRIWVAGIMLSLIAMVGSTAFLTGQNPFKDEDVIYAHRSFARAPILSLVRIQDFFNAVDQSSRSTNNERMNSASSQAIAFLNSPDAVSSPDVILIIVESWGLPLDAQLAQALNAPLTDPRIAQSYDTSYGTVDFRGTTVSAEARELCDSKMGFGILLAPPDALHGCLPASFSAHNYQSISVHGYLSSMFQRRTWYRTIGFDQSWFGPDLDKLKLPKCGGAFPGTCDAAIAEWIGNSILSAQTGRPRFIYWLTLNSHLPVPAHPNLPDDGVCSTLLSLRGSVALCSWFRLVRNVHQSIQHLALTPSVRPRVFILVGDHAPAFEDPQLRRNFSATDVPYVLFTPKRAISR